MKSVVLAAALLGLMSVTALAGNIPTSDFASPPPPPPQRSTSTSSSLTLAEVVLTIVTLITR